MIHYQMVHQTVFGYLLQNTLIPLVVKAEKGHTLQRGGGTMHLTK